MSKKKEKASRRGATPFAQQRPSKSKRRAPSLRPWKSSNPGPPGAKRHRDASLERKRFTWRAIVVGEARGSFRLEKRAREKLARKKKQLVEIEPKSEGAKELSFRRRQKNHFVFEKKKTRRGSGEECHSLHLPFRCSRYVSAMRMLSSERNERTKHQSQSLEREQTTDGDGLSTTMPFLLPLSLSTHTFSSFLTALKYDHMPQI